MTAVQVPFFSLAKARDMLFAGSRNGDVSVMNRLSKAQREARLLQQHGGDRGFKPNDDKLRSEDVAVHQVDSSWEFIMTLWGHSDRVEALLL